MAQEVCNQNSHFLQYRMRDVTNSLFPFVDQLVSAMPFFNSDVTVAYMSRSDKLHHILTVVRSTNSPRLWNEFCSALHAVGLHNLLMPSPKCPEAYASQGFSFVEIPSLSSPSINSLPLASVSHEELLDLKLACCNSVTYDWKHLADYWDHLFVDHLQLSRGAVKSQLSCNVRSQGMSDLDKLEKLFELLGDVDRKLPSDRKLDLCQLFAKAETDVKSSLVNILFRRRHCPSSPAVGSPSPQSIVSNVPPPTPSADTFYGFLDSSKTRNLPSHLQGETFCEALLQSFAQIRQKAPQWLFPFDYLSSLVRPSAADLSSFSSMSTLSQDRKKLLWCLQRPFFDAPVRWALTCGGTKPAVSPKPFRSVLTAPILGVDPDQVRLAYESLLLSDRLPDVLLALKDALLSLSHQPLGRDSTPFHELCDRLSSPASFGYSPPRDWPFNNSDLAAWSYDPARLIQSLSFRNDFLSSPSARLFFFRCLQDCRFPQDFFFTPDLLFARLLLHRRQSLLASVSGPSLVPVESAAVAHPDDVPVSDFLRPLLPARLFDSALATLTDQGFESKLELLSFFANGDQDAAYSTLVAPPFSMPALAARALSRSLGFSPTPVSGTPVLGVPPPSK